jgi:hypothetical protein
MSERFRGTRASSRAFALVVVILAPATAHAGMVMYTLSDVVSARLQVISFFIFLSLLLAFVFQRCWNLLAKDFSRMPALSYRHSVAAIVVASLFCGLILTMISGARELMTPGAWDKIGTHYKLREPKQEPAAWLDSARRRAIENFRDALWNYAQHYEGRLPDDPTSKDMTPSVWRSPDSSGTPYSYLPRRDKKVSSHRLPQESAVPPSASSGAYVLAFEPMTFGSERFVLLSSGEVLKMQLGELMARVDADTAVDAKVRNSVKQKR